METAGGVSVGNSKLVLSTTVRKKTDTKSEGGSSSSKDKVAAVVGLSSLPDFVLGESPSIRVPRVQFAMDQGVGHSSLPDFKLSESPSIRLPEGQFEMDQGDPISVSDSVATLSSRGHKVEGGMDTDCESEGASRAPADEAVCRGAEQVVKEVDTFDLCGSFSELDVAPRWKTKNGVILINVKTKTLYAKSYLIYDSGASVHLIRDLNLFEGVPVKIPDNEVSVVGFNTSFGNALALAKGVLKWPLEGVEAYYSRNCIGNIISEFKLRDTHNLNREEDSDKWRDTVTASRLSSSSDKRDDLVFRRGLEGLLICDVASMILNRSRRQLYSFPTVQDRREYSTRVGSVEGSVPEWLERLNLTAREAQASMALEVFSCDNRERVMIQVMGCMNIPESKREDIIG